MIDDERLSLALRDLSRTRHTHHDLRGILDTATQQLRSLLPLSGVAVSLSSTAQQLGPVVGTDADAVRYQHLQHSLDEGPCVEAVRLRQPVAVSEVAETYAVLGECTRDRPPRSIVAVPLVHGDRCLGVLGLYADQPLVLPPVDLDAVQVFVDVLGSILLDVETRAAREEFVAAASHEMRAPLTNIAGFVELLQDQDVGRLNEEQAGFVRAIERSSRRLRTLADDLLTATGLEAGADPRPHVEVDLGKVVLDAQFALEQTLAARALDVSFEGLGDAVVVLGNPGHLESVVVNLVGNAVKFTPDGGRVTCTLERRGRSAVLTVADNGAGITRGDQPHLFERFYRSPAARDGDVPGSGLGLSIVDRIVRDHGGSVTVASAHLVGSTFRVEVPLAAADSGP